MKRTEFELLFLVARIGYNFSICFMKKHKTVNNNQKGEKMQKIKSTIIPLLATIYISSGPVLANDNESYQGDGHMQESYSITGEVRTGFNSSKGQPVYDLGGFLGGLSWNFVFAHEPNDTESSPITVDTDEDRLLATGVDQFFYSALVGFDTNLLDQTALNVPYRDMPIIVDGLSGTRSKLEPISIDNFKERRSLSLPVDPISIKDWYSARGVASVKCSSSERARVMFKFSNLIPHGVYSVWGLYGLDSDNDGIRDGLTPPIAFGGVPNVLVADSNGKSTFKRTLPFCPNADQDILTVEVAYHIDGSTLGGTPAMFPTENNNTFLANVAVPTQLSFNFGGLNKLD